MASGNTTYKSYYKPEAGAKPWYQFYWDFLDALDLDVHNLEDAQTQLGLDFAALEIDVTNLEALINSHATRHQSGGADQIDITALSGDSIKVDTITEKTLDNGVLVDSVLVKDGFISGMSYPSISDQAATVQFVEDAVSAVATGITWRGAVIDQHLTAPPVTPINGDRYIVAGPATGAWAGHETEIAQWSISLWIFTVPEEGWTVYVDDENLYYTFDGAAWEDMGAFFAHNSLASKQGGDGADQFYHVTQLQHIDLTGFADDANAQLGQLNTLGSVEFVDITTGQISNITGAAINLISDNDLSFKDQYLAAGINLSEAANTSLDVWFDNSSIIGALNELALEKISVAEDIEMDGYKVYLDVAKNSYLYNDGTFTNLIANDLLMADDEVGQNRGLYWENTGLDLWHYDNTSGEGGNLHIAEGYTQIISDGYIEILAKINAGSGIRLKTINGGNIEFWSESGEISFRDKTATTAINFSEIGESVLDPWFDNVSVLGAINELALQKADTAEAIKYIAHEIRNETGSPIAKGIAIYPIGYDIVEDKILVGIADKNTPTKHAFGVTAALISNNTNGYIIQIGDFEDYNTSSWALNDFIYLGAAGVMTNVRPTGTDCVQHLGKVSRVHAASGMIELNIDGESILPNFERFNEETDPANDDLFLMQDIITGEYKYVESQNMPAPEPLQIYAASEGESSNTTPNTWQQKLNAQVTPGATGNYKIAWSCEAHNESSGNTTEVRIELDNTTEIGFGSINKPYYSPVYSAISGFIIVELTAALHNIDIDFHTRTGDGDDAYIRRARIEITKAND